MEYSLKKGANLWNISVILSGLFFMPVTNSPLTLYNVFIFSNRVTSNGWFDNFLSIIGCIKNWKNKESNIL